MEDFKTEVYTLVTTDDLTKSVVHDNLETTQQFVDYCYELAKVMGFDHCEGIGMLWGKDEEVWSN